ncbi:MAG: ribosome-associated GTPase EngA [Acidobacteria bacterium]|nr:ribosome-associated GTPase EngA [Acidobacteriota bacterium]
MTRLPVVAVVGRPNVGKSTLVNRILRRRAAVVEEKPGVTRDRIRQQAEAAVTGADVVVFVADATTPYVEDDRAMARLVQASGLPVVLAANKADGPGVDLEVGHLWGLGLGEPRPISALHGRGTGDLLDEIVALLPPADEAPPADRVPTLAILGRPNVGKSTLLNRLLGQERVLVSPEPGTTRDPIDVVVDLGGEAFRVWDTAGIRRASRVEEPTEYFAVMRAREALAQADVALLVTDAVAGITHQDQRLAEEVAEAGVGLIILLNKWDAANPEDKEIAEDGTADRLGFVDWAPVLRISALRGARLQRLAPAVRAVLEARRTRLATPELNRRLRDWQEAHPAPARRGRRARIIYAVQAGTEPPTFVLFVRGELGPDYLRFIENRLRAEYGFNGTPLRLVARSRRRGTKGPGR